MSTNVKPQEQLEFRGVVTAGNPIQRPRNTAEICENFRVMPGNYLRLRSGRVKRASGPGGDVLQVFPARTRDFWGVNQHFMQIGAAWKSLVIGTPSYTPGATIEAITTTHDGSFASTNPVAACNLDDRPLFYNGKGERASTGSFPPLSTYDSTGRLRYFGLDSYFFGYTTPGVFTPFGAPEASFAVATGGCNKWLTSLSIYMGLWNKATDHFSNGQYIHHWVTPQTVNVKISITNLERLLYAAHDTDEANELYFVFYATIDGGRIPYLILNKTLDGPYAVPVNQTAPISTDLSIESAVDIGFVHDLVHEMPLENHPPRPMRSIAFVNSRLYGVLMNGGSFRDNLIANPALDGVNFDMPGYNMFNYIPDKRDLAAVVWSAAAGDSLGSDLLGDPLQSWPLLNIAYTPSIEQPLVVAAAPVDAALDAGQVTLVITNTHTFYLQEQADGIHDWNTISDTHGIGKPSTLRKTEHGLMWVTQRNQIVLLRPGALSLNVLSTEYQSLLTGTPRCADYILDPIEQIDRYQVWMDTGKSICHDFLLTNPGVAYSCTNHDFTAAATAVDVNGAVHHILAKADFYSHEAQPEGGVVVTDDGTEITGVHRRNWDDFGDADVRKEMPMVDVIGDGASAASLGHSPLEVSWYGDFEQVTGANKKVATGAQSAQSTTDSTFRYKLAAANKFWYKLVFTLTGHSTENGGTSSKYADPATEGNGASNFFGSIMRLLWRLGVSENRA